MTPATSLSSIAQTNQLDATQSRTTHRHGGHFVMTEGNTGSNSAGNAGAVQSFASILAGVAGTAVKAAGGLAKAAVL